MKDFYEVTCDNGYFIIGIFQAESEDEAKRAYTKDAGLREEHINNDSFLEGFLKDVEARCVTDEVEEYLSLCRKNGIEPEEVKYFSTMNGGGIAERIEALRQ